jgi:dTDP-glucose pyrophosphorylase
MKALVLSGGTGTRLRPITHTSAKQLVPVADNPVLFYGPESLAEAGITEVGIVVGDTAAEIEEAVGDGSRFGLDVTCIPQERPLEEFRTHRPDAQILLTQVAELDAAGRVLGLEEKPEHPRSDLALAGVYLFTPAVHEAVRALRPSWRGELEITHSSVGPHTSIAENCRITHSELEFSIVLRDSSIDGVGRIESSLIGRHAEVTPAAGVPSAHRLVPGDHSKVQIRS